MKEVTRVDLRLVEVMVVKVSWFLKVILNCSVRVSVTTVSLVTGVNILHDWRVCKRQHIFQFLQNIHPCLVTGEVTRV